MRSCFQLIRFRLIGKLVGKLPVLSNLFYRFQLIRFRLIGKLDVVADIGSEQPVEGFQLIRFRLIGKLYWDHRPDDILPVFPTNPI